MNRKLKRTNLPRYILQWGVLLFIVVLAFIPASLRTGTTDFEAYCPFGGIQALGSYLLSGSLACSMTSTQIVMGILLLIGVLLFSKLFCAFICPVGTVSEWLGKLGQKLKVRLTITGIADKALRSLKYVLLFITFYFTFQSNELFCKKFDPYFGTATGFGADVVLWMSISAIAIVVLGSVFIRLFWCKYLCPLAALSNIFKFTLFFAAVVALYIILLKAGINISYVWPLAVATGGGYLIELWGQKSKFFPVTKITRNEVTCTNCNLCTKKCPQGIDVANLKVVKHVDCNMCGDCVLVCPVKNTLNVNKKDKLNRLPLYMTIVLVVLGFLLGSVWEVPTISQMWGDSADISKGLVYEQKGLKNIKCFGSSMAFANKMKQVEGVYGVETYVSSHGIKLFYDPAVLDSVKIQKLLFTPQKKPITPVAKDVDSVYVVKLMLENFFDPFDFSYLGILLKQKTNAVGLSSEYACPVIVKLYFPGKVDNMESLIKTLEVKTLTYESTAGPVKVKLGYKVTGKPEFSVMSKYDYISSLFEPYEDSFNSREKYSDQVLKSYIFPLGENKALRSRFPYIVSHVSNDTGVVEFHTRLDSTFTEVGEFVFVDTMTNIENIRKSLLSDSLTITYTNGTTGKVKNMFDFKFLDQHQAQK